MAQQLPKDWDLDLSAGSTAVLILTSLAEAGRREEELRVGSSAWRHLRLWLYQGTGMAWLEAAGPYLHRGRVSQQMAQQPNPAHDPLLHCHCVKEQVVQQNLGREQTENPTSRLPLQQQQQQLGPAPETHLHRPSRLPYALEGVLVLARTRARKRLDTALGSFPSRERNSL